MKERIHVRVIRLQQNRAFRRLAKYLLTLWCIDIPPEVQIGSDLHLEHHGFGVVINPNSRIGDGVTIYHNVTIARTDSWRSLLTETLPIEIGDDVVLCPGTVVLGGADGLSIGRGTVIGANSTLRCSTGEWEVWAGSPARKVGSRRVAQTEMQGLVSVKKGIMPPTESNGG
jgi:serine O-acetyltransferase